MRQLRIEMQTQIRSIVGILSPTNLVWELSGNSGGVEASRFSGRSSEIDIAHEHPTWIITRGVQQIILSRGAHLTVTQFLRDVIFILKVRSINLRQELKNKFTIPLDINCLDLLGRIASSCSCASHRNCCLEGKLQQLVLQPSADDVMKVKYRENSIFTSR